ncbi:CGI-146 protein [Strigomonas culicis]|uniref:CGI-146 protein n=1 Tax=Strigomonas culicis TaxID=28005 RepID=S9UTX0_9TRYP|nr:CGI-146 protein [Strigomonas culicis]|eukprot:EPY34387.1 CGI-146 protein [Strigomonas culicis]
MSQAPPLSSAAPSERYPPNTVLLNVYDISTYNSYLSSLGIGLHHAGIEVYGREYMYGRCAEGTGLGSCEPKHCVPHTFAEQYALGYTGLSEEEVDELMESLEEDPQWGGSAYHLIYHNCIHFAEALAAHLLPPRARAEQYARRDARLWQGVNMETVQVDGAGVTVPELMPPHVMRLCWLGNSYLPTYLINKLEDFDKSSTLQQQGA